MKKRCAVCGDTTKSNVRLAWRRERDGKEVNVCCTCAEAGLVTEDSIDNYTTEDTLYIRGNCSEAKNGGHYVSRQGGNNVRRRVAECSRK